jgi:hypothetical protein
MEVADPPVALSGRDAEKGEERALVVGELN